LDKKTFSSLKQTALEIFIRKNRINSTKRYELLLICNMIDEQNPFGSNILKYENTGLKNRKDVLNNSLIKSLYNALNETHKKMFNKLIDLAPLLGNGVIVSYYHRGYRTENAYNNIVPYIEYLGDLLTYQHINFDTLEYFGGKEYFNEYSTNISQYLTTLLSLDDGNKVYEHIKNMVYNSENLIHFSSIIIRALIQCDREGSNEVVLDLLKAAKLSEGLRASIMESIDLGTIETYKFFLRYVREEKLSRFSSVKRSFLCYTGLEYYVSEKTIDYLSGYVYDCLLECKTTEYLESDNAVKFYIGLYSLACHEYKNATDYIQTNLLSLPEYKQVVSLEFISKSMLTIEASKINYILENLKDINLFFCLDSCKIKFDTNEEKRIFITLVSEKLSTLKMKDLKRKSLDGTMNSSVTLYILYKLILKLAHEIDDLYELVYPFFDKYFYASYYSNTFNPYESGIKNSIMKDTLISSLSGNQMSFALETINELNPTFTQEDYLKIASHFRSKRSEVRQCINSLLLKADGNILLACAKMLLGDKNIQMQNGGISLLIDAFDKIKENALFHEIRGILKNLEVSPEMESEKAKLLGDKVKSGNKNLFFDENYKLDAHELMPFEKNMHKHLKNAINKLLPNEKKLSTDALVKVIQKFADVFESHSGENIEYINYSSEKHIGKINYDFNIRDVLYFLNRIVSRDANLTYDMCPFYLEYAEITKTLTDEEFVALWVFTQLYSNVVYNNNFYGAHDYISGIFLSNFIDQNLLFDFDVSKSKKFQNNNFNYFRRVIEILLLQRNETSNISIFESNQNLILGFLSEFIIFERERVSTNKKVYDKLFVTASSMFKSQNKYRTITLVSQNEISLLGMLSNIIQEIFDKDFEITNKEIFTNIFYNLCDLQLADRNMPTYMFSEIIKRIKSGEIKKDYIYKLVLQEYNTSVIENIKHALRGGYHYGQKQKYYSEDIKALIQTIYETVTNAILETELERTETATIYSKMVMRCDFIGAENFIKAVFKMGSMPFERGGYGYSSDGGKKTIFSHIVSATLPEKGLTLEKFASVLSTYKVSEQKLLEASMYNLRFMPYVEEYLKIKGLTKCAYFFKAHMNESYSEEDIKLVARYTDIDAKDMQNGQMDLNWFKESYEELGEENFQKLYSAAKYITDGAKHKRAQYFADAVRGKLTLDEVLARINDKRNQEMILAFGLIPLATDKLKDALSRYKRLQLFLKESKQYGAQKKQSEALKVSIAMNNLARNYGLKDATRFLWLMEIELFDSMLAFFEPKEIEDIVVYISIENIEKPKIIVSKDDKILKSLPSKYAKIPYILELKEALKDLKDQYRRARHTLENSMVYEDYFTFDELSKLQKHPIITTILKDLLFVSNGNIGLLQSDKLIDYTGKSIKLKASDTLKIAHPADLLENNSWVNWQDYLLKNKIIQQFKQVYRELYTMTADEVLNNGFTNRFAGYQIDGKRTLGILKSRGWVINECDGFEKVNHKENVRIDLYSYADWFTAAEIESPTLEMVEFIDNKTNKKIDMSSLSKVLYSETMRDIDLVVSVAYVGGVDPMMNHTTIEMRKRVLTHNLELFSITNYTQDDNHIMIEGTHGSYSVHLGSGIIHVKGKGMLPVFPVHSQHRGHIFLPFVDDDPKTSEIITKVLMLCEDNKIKDPSILVHLR